MDYDILTEIHSPPPLAVFV